MARIVSQLKGASRALYSHRGLLRVLVHREVVNRTAGTLLGGGWMLLQPALQMAGMWFFLSVVLNVRTAGQVPFLNYFLVGMVVWTMMSEILQRSLTVLVEYAPLYQRSLFPVAMLPLVPIAVSGGIYALVLAVVVALLEGPLPALWATLYLGLVLLWLVPIAYIFAVLGLFIREARQLVPFALTLVMYLSPILYSPSQLPVFLRDWMYINPVADVMVMLHTVTQGEPWVLANCLRPLLISLLLAPIAWWGFQRAQPHMREAL